jgi:glycosyltransferase involved in cell wall biosynthesis
LARIIAPSYTGVAVEISVVYPAYNERGNIARTLERSLAALRGRFESFEIVVVNDGSTDETGELAETLARQHPQITVLHNARNMGVGPTLLRGLQAARHALVVHNGMDYPFDLEDLDKLVAELPRADVVVAARDGHAGYTIWRRIVSEVNRRLLRLLFGLPLTDLNFMQLYRREVLQTVRVGATSAGFVMPETIILAHDMGFRVVEVRIPYHARQSGRSVLGRPKVLWASLKDLLRFWWRRLFAGSALRVAPRGEQR